MKTMSSSEFTFIPRKLSKHKRTSNDASGSRLPAQRKETQAEQVPSTTASGRKQKEEKYLDDGIYTVLLELALSDYALWSNFELFETMEANEDGFVPISCLIQTSPVFAWVTPIPPEATLIRCARASKILEGRLIVSENPHSDWRIQARMTDSETQGGFEIRRKDRENFKSRIRKLTSYHWDNRTIYVENLPFRAKSFYAVHDFIRKLLSGNSTSAEPDVSPLQSVSFPAHQKDRSDAPPPTIGKGFAFIILSHAKDVDYLLRRWPWNLDDRPDDHAGGESTKALQEASELGFRCMSKQRWNELKEEYLSLQRRLLEKTLTSNVSGTSTSNPPQASMPLGHRPEIVEGESASAERKQNSSMHKDEVPAWFPAGCLVFVKNVHPETNKTTLRTLFASAFEKDSSRIDYVDYTKGLDSCYLRLSGPQHARTLVSYFSEHQIVQSNPLDNIGTLATEGSLIEVELILGKREEMYWEKVPEKIRKTAITNVQGGSSLEEPVQGQTGKDEGERKRKRRKRS